ncbi:MAG: hypothetical protein M3174_03390 [Actinomycetota bacterium]|nr:hypothetical protein [Actinomycetota bacterium]
MTSTPSPRRDNEMEPDVDLVAVDPPPNDEELASLRAALMKLIEEERRGTRLSLWRRAGRAQGRRLGMSDYRDRFSPDDAWRLSTRFPFGGREYPGLVGRGDAR